MSDIEGLFRSIGLSDYETKSYMSLLRMPRSTATQVAKNSNIPAAKVYDVLNRLVYKGFVLEEPGKPKKYKSVDPKIAVRCTVESRVRKLEQIENEFRRSLSELEMDDTDRGVWVIKGRESVESIIEKVVLGTKSRIYVRTSSDKAYLEMILSELKGVEIDFEENSIGNNMINSDGREMVIYLNKTEALWVRNPKYCRIRENS